MEQAAKMGNDPLTSDASGRPVEAAPAPLGGSGSGSGSETNKGGGINWAAAIQKGLIGGVGAVPGTCGSHPFDVIKIRMQVQGDPLRQAVTGIATASPGGGSCAVPAAGGAGASA